MKTIQFAVLSFVLLTLGFATQNAVAQFIQTPLPIQVPAQNPVLIQHQDDHGDDDHGEDDDEHDHDHDRVVNPIPGFPNQGNQGGQTQVVTPLTNTTTLSKSSMREIDRLVMQLTTHSKELHDEYHEHLEGVRHAEKLDKEVTAMEKLATSLHAFIANSDGGAQSMTTFRGGSNEFIQLAVRIARTIDLTEPWLPGGNARVGTSHMRNSARRVLGVAHQIDAYLPVDTQIIDSQTDRLEDAIKELHDEFHEHLENYEVSSHLDEDLEQIETIVEKMHETAHDKTWAQMDLNQLSRDVNTIRQKTAHIESLFVRQAEIGVRTSDWIGIEHSRDAITDVLSSAYLLDHMIRKTGAVRQSPPIRTDPDPLRDRHGHPITPRPGVSAQGFQGQGFPGQGQVHGIQGQGQAFPRQGIQIQRQGQGIQIQLPGQGIQGLNQVPAIQIPLNFGGR